MKIISCIAALTFTSIFTLAPASAQEHKAAHVERAVAVLHPTQGSKVQGSIIFSKVADGIKVEGEVSGLTPGKHGFHVHEFGDNSAPDGTSAGGHFNPTGHKHGARDAEERHAGDFGNIEAGQDGVAKVSFVDKKISFDGQTSILGRGLVVHAKEDDLKTQPTGDAGGRVAVGVIGVAGAKAAAK